MNAPASTRALIEDRAYQQRAQNDARAQFATGKRAVLLVSPTGSGKTTIAAEITVASEAKGNKIVALAHRRELIQQMVARFRSFGLNVGAEGLNKLAPVQVTSPHVILARGEMPEANLVIVDEAHHYVSEQWGRIPQTYLRVGAKLIGLSATPERGDGIGLGNLFDGLVVVAQISELTELGYLVPCPKDRIFLPKGDVRALAIEPVDAYRKFAPGSAAVVFAPHVKAAYDYAAGFEMHGIRCGVIHGELEDEERDATLARFASGEINVLSNVMVLTEGWDCPRAATCILARRIGSPSLYLQKVGRVLRPHCPQGCKRTGCGHEGAKTFATLIDLAGNVDIHGFPGEDRIWSLTGFACTRRGESDGVRHCRTCGEEIPQGEPRCPDCGRAVPELATPRAEGVELEKAAERAEKQKTRADLDLQKRVRILATLYRRGIEKNQDRRPAHRAYKGMTGHYPDAALSVAAWELANNEVASKRGDAYEPPIVREGASNGEG